MNEIKVKVIDAICGAGKTTAAINYINHPSNVGERFMYVTPYLTEVQRIKETCVDKKFKEPQTYGSKMQDIFRLIEKGDNIVTTHNLFNRFTPDVINLVKLSGYILIMDEVADVVSPLEISSDDANTILEKYAHIDGVSVIWDDKDYVGRFEDYKNLCDLGCVTAHKVGEQVNLLIWMFPIKVFEAFSDIFILTYIFDAQVQKYYYDFYNIQYEYLYVKDFEFTEEYQDYNVKEKYGKLINVYDKPNLNQIGYDRNALSRTWFDKNRNNAVSRVLKNNINNFLRNVVKAKGNDCIWTTFISCKDDYSSKGFSKSFVSLNMRATNEYRTRKNVAYIANRFMNPYIKLFFDSCGIEVDEDAFALSELIQFIFRSRLRCCESINIYIPSRRMRTLLCDWAGIELDEEKALTTKK